MAGEKILHVGYDSLLIELREAVLHRHGFSVVTVKGNEAAKQTAPDSFDLVIVGNGGTLEQRQDIVSWFAERWPNLPILVMHAAAEEEFPGATVEFIGDTPQDWIVSIRRAIDVKKE